jgi:hypothetical protein
MQLCKLADMQVCKYARRVKSLICLNHRWRAATGLATFHRRQAAETHRNISYFLKPKVNLKKSGKCIKLQPKLFNPKNYSFLSVHLINFRHNADSWGLKYCNQEVTHLMSIGSNKSFQNGQRHNFLCTKLSWRVILCLTVRTVSSLSQHVYCL